MLRNMVFACIGLLLAMPAHAEWTESTARALLEAIAASRLEGLTPGDYRPEALEAALASADPQRLEAAATASFLVLARDYAHGRTPSADRRHWHVAAPVLTEAQLAARMQMAQGTGRISESLVALLPTHAEYRALRAALASTPEADTAIRDQIRINLERWRWMPRTLGARHLLVNVPAFEAKLVEDGQVTATHRVIVGATKTPTPQFSAVATGVTLNPPWVVPQSIIRESVGGLIARSPATARARGYSWTGSGGGISVTQQPGPGNALGQFKIDMPNPHSVFLHDTPNKALFARERRALSHGCIRTDRIADLVDRLLPDWDAARIAGQLETRITTRVPLAEQLPVFITYFTAVAGPTGEIVSLADIYGRDAPVLAALGGRAVAYASAAPVAAETNCQAAMPNRPA